MSSPAHSPATQALSQTFAEILDGLCATIAVHASRHWVAAPTILVLWSYLRRLTRRFDRLLARYASGRLAQPAPRPPRAASAAPRGRPRARLFDTFAWLSFLEPKVRPFGSQLQHLLNQPDMAAILATVPQAGRMLRPLRSMLGHEEARRPLPRPRPAPLAETPRGQSPAGWAAPASNDRASNDRASNDRASNDRAGNDPMCHGSAADDPAPPGLATA